MLQGCGLGAWGWKATDTPKGSLGGALILFCSTAPGALWPRGWAGGRAQNKDGVHWVSPNHGQGPRLHPEQLQ